MRFFLLLACCAISLNTSAQFWKKKVRYAPLEPAYFLPVNPTAPAPSVNTNLIFRSIAMPRIFDFDKMEQAIMKEAKRNMRYRVYHEASVNFTALAGLYLLRNRYSEAKWYLLQSISVSHDAKLKLSNLLTLAGIKTDLGETSLAKTDLLEARALANANGFRADVIEIDKLLLALNNSKPLLIKPELRYSESVESAARNTAAIKTL